MDFRNQTRIWLGTAVSLVAALVLACALLPPGLARTAVSDIVTALLMLSALVACSRNAATSVGRIRLFWLLQAAEWGLLLADQGFWITYDLILRIPMPLMHPADVLLFLAGVPLLAGLLLRPHSQSTDRSARLGTLDFLLLLLWWFYLYVFFVICWQYVRVQRSAYDRNYDLLDGAKTVIVAGVLVLMWRSSFADWKKFYGRYFAVFAFNIVTTYVLNHAIENDTYFSGSWFDVPYSVSYVLFTAVALSGRGLPAPTESSKDEAYASGVTATAMLAVLSLPVMAGWAMLNQRVPPEIGRFRLLATLATMFVMALLLFFKHYRLNQELQRSSAVFEEASLTDPLTGVRNRRFFSATIAADISQTLRSYADGHDVRTRDLVFYLIDADNFKEINDRFGHDAGDRVLVEMSRRISSCIRHSDVLVRWGGEEFLIVSRYTDRREATILAARVLAAVGDSAFPLGTTGESIYRTCSIGWAAFPWIPDQPDAVDYEEVLSLADQGLRQAKEAGKNRAIGIAPAKPAPLDAELATSTGSARLAIDLLAVAGPAAQGAK